MDRLRNSILAILLAALLPTGASANALARSAFLEAAALEERGELLGSADLFEAAADAGQVAGWWRASRSVWRHADALPIDAEDERLALFQRADGLAARGLEADPDCGGCALWKYAAMARLTQHYGWLWASRHAREMKRLLDHGIAVRPQHRDPNGNSTLANLLYASATFYRMVPEWWWLPLLVGIRGDTERALADIDEALRYSEKRIDYHVERGAVLLCTGQRHRREDRIAGGREALRVALALPRTQASDEIDQRYAAELLEDSSNACGWTREGFMDIEGEGRQLARQLR